MGRDAVWYFSAPRTLNPAPVLLFIRAVTAKG
jgi:hypothetical protein